MRRSSNKYCCFSSWFSCLDSAFKCDTDFSDELDETDEHLDDFSDRLWLLWCFSFFPSLPESRRSKSRQLSTLFCLCFFCVWDSSVRESLLSCELWRRLDEFLTDELLPTELTRSRRSLCCSSTRGSSFSHLSCLSPISISS